MMSVLAAACLVAVPVLALVYAICFIRDDNRIPRVPRVPHWSAYQWSGDDE